MDLIRRMADIDFTSTSRVRQRSRAALWGWLLVLALFFAGLRLRENEYGAVSGGGSQSVSMAVQDHINPNRETWISLARLPGIGKVRAMEIVQFREHYQNQHQQDPFRRADDLTQVPGIGDITIGKIKSYLVFDSQE